jgi:putative ABC transport system permease protein
LFDEHDVRGSPEVLLISQSFAHRVFPGEDPIGQHMKAGPDFDDAKRPWGTVVGVVADVKQDSLAVGTGDAFYMPMGQWNWVDGTQSLVVRASGDPTALVPALEGAIWSVDKDQPITRVVTMDALVAGSAANRRFALTLFEAFGVVALLLAAVGIYGVLSGSVSERTREIGVRSALGASRGAILSLIGRDGMQLTAFGVVFGLAGAFAASRAIAALLFGITPLDPITYVATAGLLGAVAALACWLPAWRATRVEPADTLREG